MSTTDAPAEAPAAQDSNPLDKLRTIAQHVDAQFLPTLNELPGLVVALVLDLAHGDTLQQIIADVQARLGDTHPSQVAGNESKAAVASLISPPIPGADGGSAEQADQIKQLQAQIDELKAAGAAPQSDQPQIAGGAPTEQELFEREQRAALQTATQQPWTAESHPEDPAA